MSTMTYTGALVVTECWCGITYAIPKTLHNYVEREHNDGRDRDVWCPLGHKWSFAGKPEVERERERRERVEAQLTATRDQLAAEQRDHASTRGQLTKARNRAKAGVCPCCKRSFVQLARHMQSQHPDFEA